MKAITAETKTIVVVDDYASICEITAKILQSEGYRVLTATTGEQALRLVRETPGIDLLVTDFEMPKMRGDELARRCAAIHSGLPIILISSHAGPISIPKPFRRLPKPFQPAALIEAVSQAVDERPSRTTPQSTSHEQQSR